MINLPETKIIRLEDYREEAREIVQTYFKDREGKRLIFSDHQCDIFNLIWKKLYARVHIEAFTRFGKSLAIACGTLMRITTFPEPFSIVAGTQEQSGIIMGYIIDHTFDNQYFSDKFKLDPGETAEMIRRFKNKKKMNFVVESKRTSVSKKDLLGEVFITNAKGALGFGAKNVILDEAPLVTEEEEALVFRMLGDDPKESFYFKIGNSWASPHFDRSRADPNYFHMKVDWKTGLKEGRISIDQVEEARPKPFFGVLYECKVPLRDTADGQGWMPLLTRDDIDKALVDESAPFGVNKLGGDVAGGGRNFSTVVQRHMNVAKLLLKNQDPDTMNFAEAVLNFRHGQLAGMDGIFIDSTGIGKGASDILMKEIQGVIGFNGAEKPKREPDQNKYINIRAMCFWRLREWILAGGKLVKGEESLENTWYQLTTVKYRKSLERMRGKLQIMSKEEMQKRGLPSPDVADGIMMTFLTDDEPLNITDERPGAILEEDKKFERYGLFPRV